MKKIERLGGYLGEIVIISVHKTLLDATSLYDMMPRPQMHKIPKIDDQTLFWFYLKDFCVY